MFKALILVISLLFASQDPTPTVHGRITLRENGAPVVGLPVVLFSKTYASDGTLQTKEVTSTNTNEAGYYTMRLPSGGPYTIKTNGKSASGELFVPESSPVARGEVDLAVSRGKPVTIRGQLIDGLAHRYPHWDWVWLVSREASKYVDLSPPPMTDKRTRLENVSEYAIHNIAPGSYFLCSYRFDEIQYRAQNVIPIEVRDSDLNVDIVSEGSYPITGRVRFEDKHFPLRLAIHSVDAATSLLIPGANVHPDGTFSFLPAPAGVFRISVLGAPAPFYVKSVLRGGEDVLVKGLTLPGSTSSSLVVVIASDGAEISGNAPLSTCVVLIPESRGLLRVDLHQIAWPDRNGRFSIGGVAPGKYKIYDVTDFTAGAQFDREFMSRFEGKPIEVAAGSHVQVGF